MSTTTYTPSALALWALGFLRPYRRALSGLAGLSLAEVLLRAAQPWALKAVVDYALIGVAVPAWMARLLGPEMSGNRFELLNEMDGLSEDVDVLFLLTTNRVEVLESALATRPGRVYSRGELLNRVRGYEFASERTVDSHVKNLRRKLEADPQHPEIIETVMGAGYRLGLARDH